MQVKIRWCLLAIVRQVLVAVLLFGWPGEFPLSMLAFGQPAAPSQASKDEAPSAETAERDRLSKQATELRAEDKFAAAAAAAEQMLALDRKLHGDKSETVATTLSLLGEIRGETEQWELAKNAVTEALAIHQQLHGEGDWRVTDDKVHLIHLDQIAALNAEGRQRIRAAERQDSQVMALSAEGKSGEAIALGEKGLATYRQLLPDSPFAATLACHLGLAYREHGDYDRAEALLRETVTTARTAYGERHPLYAMALGFLGTTHQYRKEYSRAELYLRESTEAWRLTRGDMHPDYLVALHNLADYYVRTRDYAQAETQRKQLVELRRQVRGENEGDYAFSLEMLAELYLLQEQFAKAEPLCREALALRQKHLPPEDNAYWFSVARLVKVETGLKRYDQAEELFRELLTKYAVKPGKLTPIYAFTLDRLSSVQEDRQDYAGAEPLLREALAIFQQVHGEKHESTINGENNLLTILDLLADKNLALEDFPTARKYRQEILEIKRRRLGDGHKETINARHNHSLVDNWERATPEERRELTQVDKPFARMRDFADERKPRESLAFARTAYATYRRILGADHWLTVTVLSWQASLEKQLDELPAAVEHYRQALAAMEQTHGKEHGVYLVTSHNLAGALELQGKLQEARTLYLQTLEIEKRVLGEKNPLVANTLNSLAFVANNLGDVAEAESLYRQSLELRRFALGEDSTEYANSLANLAAFYTWDMGDYTAAEPLYQEAIKIYRKAVGEEHPDYARILDYLASLYTNMGDPKRAEPLYREALEIRGQALGKTHRDYGTTLNNLALVLKNNGQLSEAARMLEQASAIDRRTYGQQHPTLAIGLENLAAAYDALEEFERSEPLSQEAFEIRRLQGVEHDDFAGGLDLMARHYARRGDFKRAEALAREAVERTRQHFDRVIAVQSQRQQLATRKLVRGRMNLWFTLTAALGTPADQVYPLVLEWKAPISVQQHYLRQMRKSLDPTQQASIAPLFDQLEEASRRLASLQGSSSVSPELLGQRVRDQSDMVERLERELATASGDYRRLLEGRKQTAEDIRRVLPAGTVLVDFLEYARFQPAKPEATDRDEWPMYVDAFVVRSDRSVVRVPLGPLAPIASAVRAWRDDFGGRKGTSDTGSEMRRLVWQPLVPHLQRVETVLISPGGTLAQFPFAALPSATAGKYLLEDYALAVVTVPRLLPDLLAERPTPTDDSLLLVGGVDFSASSGTVDRATAPGRIVAANRGGERQRWNSLPGSTAEVQGLKTLFHQHDGQGKITELTLGNPTEGAIRTAAPRHRFLHFATHGFFSQPAPRATPSAPAPEINAPRERREEKPIATGFHPGLLSGVVLAGANLPVEADKDDGILSALEVESLDLSRVELATLSACETGLGENAGGEGLLGLQRAFQMAGARSTVAGLWKVDDRGTQLLMQRFYENLWGRRMSRVAALREAQLWMLNEAWQMQEGGKRGLEAVLSDQPPAADGRLPPYYWAAFVLSGDWRQIP